MGIPLLILIVFLGLWLRWGLNGTWRLSPDEALYGSWARRIADGTDVWLAATPGVDKPPLFIYAVVLSMHVYGFTEFATRFPSIIASSLAILLTHLLAHRLYSCTTMSLLAALLIALSPFAILFAPTAFADSMMVMWVLLAIILATQGQWVWAGLPMALATLTKQEAPILAPLVVILGLGMAAMGSAATPDQASLSRSLRSVLSFAIVTCIVVIAVELFWEAHRPGQPSPFLLGLSHYGGIGLVAAADIAPRLGVWWREALQYTFATPPLNGVLIVGIPALLLLARNESTRADRVLVLAIVYGLLARTLVSFQLWDRYMLILVPFLCILLARLVDWLWTMVASWQWQRMSLDEKRGEKLFIRLLPLVLVTILMIVPMSEARAGHIPVGSDHGRYWGIDQTAQFVREQIPPGSVIYHHSLGWQFAYYLYGVPLDFWWYPSLEWLAQTAASRAEHSQYIVVPSWESINEMADILVGQGMQLLPVHEAHRPDGSISFATYRIAPLSLSLRHASGYDSLI